MKKRQPSTTTPCLLGKIWVQGSLSFVGLKKRRGSSEQLMVYRGASSDWSGVALVQVPKDEVVSKPFMGRCVAHTPHIHDVLWGLLVAHEAGVMLMPRKGSPCPTHTAS